MKADQPHALPSVSGSFASDFHFAQARPQVFSPRLVASVRDSHEVPLRSTVGAADEELAIPEVIAPVVASLGQISVLSRLALFFPHFRVEGRNYAETQRASAPTRDAAASKTPKRTRTGGISAAGLSISKWDALWPLLQPPLNFAFPESLDFPSDLRAYQIDGVRFLADNDNALLADDMGTGKTSE